MGKSSQSDINKVITTTIPYMFEHKESNTSIQSQVIASDLIDTLPTNSSSLSIAATSSDRLKTSFNTPSIYN